VAEHARRALQLPGQLRPTKSVPDIVRVISAHGASVSPSVGRPPVDCLADDETRGQPMARMKYKELFTGLIRLHILHHAAEGEFYGRWMIQELARHGYQLSPGTLYPLLHTLARRGYLKSRRVKVGQTFRLLYRATAKGREANKIAKMRVRELVGEVVHGRSPAPPRLDKGRKK
jgi:PadR family transcriptional regulator, regulatory protein PadR